MVAQFVPTAAVELFYSATTSGLPADNVQAAIDSLSAVLAGGTITQGTRLVSGGGVVWGAGYIFDIAPAIYYIAGVLYSSPAARVTLATPDLVYNRFDVIAVNSAGQVVVVPGVPAANPAVPVVDPQSQLSLTIIRVDVGSGQPAAVTVATVYAENVGPPAEWTSAAAGPAGMFVLGSTLSPHSGNLCVEGVNCVAPNYFGFGTAAPLDVTGAVNLVFYLKSKGSWGDNYLVLRLTNQGGPVTGSAQISLHDGAFGFDSTNTATYQTIVVPIAQFNLLPSTLVDGLRFTVGTATPIGFYFDDCAFQGGVTSTGAQPLTVQQGDVRYARLAAANLFIAGPQTIHSDADANRGLVVQGHSVTQSANLQEWQGAGGIVLAAVNALGVWTMGDVGLGRGAARTLRIFGGNTADPTTYGALVCGVQDAVTAAVSTALTLGHHSSGVAAAGFGSSILLQLDSSTAVERPAAEAQALWATATDASRAGRLVLGAHDSGTVAGAPREGLRVEADGARALVGLCGPATTGVPVTLNGLARINAHYGDISAGTDAATVTFDLSVTDKHTLTLGGNRTLALANMRVGQLALIELVQDATGGRTVTWSTTIRWAAGLTPVLATVAGRADLLTIWRRLDGTYSGALSVGNY